MTFERSSAYIPPYAGDTLPLMNNVRYLKRLAKTHQIEFIFTSSRPEQYREATEKQLKECGFEYKTLLMGLQHGKRIVINDFRKAIGYQ